jgi:hypothetical protein
MAMPASWMDECGSGPRDRFASATLQGQHKEFLAADRIENPIVSFTNAIELFITAERLHSVRAGRMTQGLEPFDDEFLKRFGESFELSLSRRSEQERGHHWENSDPKS